MAYHTIRGPGGTKTQERTIITPNTAVQDLHEAIERGDLVRAVDILHSSNINGTSVSVDGWSPLTFACYCGCYDVVEDIIARLNTPVIYIFLI